MNINQKEAGDWPFFKNQVEWAQRWFRDTFSANELHGPDFESRQIGVNGVIEFLQKKLNKFMNASVGVVKNISSYSHENKDSLCAWMAFACN